MPYSYLEIAVAIYIAYLIGSLSSAIIVCKLGGLPDPRTRGSHNPGATNVLRIAGKKAAAITLLGDLLKGGSASSIAKWLGFNSLALSLIALSVVLGHLFPIFFRFEGGKGVATALGALLSLCWPAGLCWLGTWLFMAILFRFSSLASLVASLLAPLYLWLFTHDLFYVYAFCAIAVLLIIRHHRNIANLLHGNESKIGKKQKASDAMLKVTS